MTDVASVLFIDGAHRDIEPETPIEVDEKVEIRIMLVL